MNRTVSICEAGDYVPGTSFALWFPFRLANRKRNFHEIWKAEGSRSITLGYMSDNPREAH